MRLLHVVGARPNFMKAAPVMAAVARAGGASQELVHTGQHYDPRMSGIFFRELGLPEPDLNLGVGSGRHGEQTGEVLIRLEPVVAGRRPDWVVVYGDVNSTLAAALVAAKLGVRVAHVEAGLRSFDRTMPEELNRIATDQLADLLLTPSEDADRNLAREGIPPARVRLVGNVMIDSLARLLPRARETGAARRLGLAPPGADPPARYGVVTLHRPSNVDRPERLAPLVAALDAIAERIPLAFPVHPRTGDRLAAVPGARAPGLVACEPLGYLEFVGLVAGAALVITDSGGIQEETTWLGIPCLTVRDTTERPATVELGTNRLVGTDPAALVEAALALLDGRAPHARGVPPLWDGRAGERVASALREGA